MNKLVLPILALLAVIPITAFADQKPNTLNYNLNDTYNVHLVHVGDYVLINNTFDGPHTIIGSDGQGYDVDTTIPSTMQAELHFLFPGEFAFYDPANCNVGIFYVYEIGTNLTSINPYNHTSTSDLYHKPACQNVSSIPITQPAPVVQNTTNTTITSVPIVNNGGSVSTPAPTIQDNLTFTNTSNATYWQGQAQYWQDQSNTWENKYNGLLASLRALLG